MFTTKMRDKDGNIVDLIDILRAAGASADPIGTGVVGSAQLSPWSSICVDDEGNAYDLVDVLSTIGGGGGSGTTNYNALTNKPKINGVTLQGDKTFEDFGLESLNAEQIEYLKNLL